MDNLRVGEFNDSFPPTIDGVAQAVKNYASVMHKNHCHVTVVTPRYRDVVDNYPFEVFRYQSVPLDKNIGYRAGNPFDPATLLRLRRKRFDLIHVHAPFASSVLVRNFNRKPKVPVIFTYHTKFDIEIPTRVKLKGLQHVARSFVRENINSADEVWAVSEGCGQSLRRLGYKGRYLVMENGTDFAFGKADPLAVAALRQKYGVRDDDFVFLFVGRMRWYKNLRLILDTLKIARGKGLPFQAIFVGGGYDAQAIRDYADECGLRDCTSFTGPVYDREQLRAYYSLADLFLFPSTYDTSGIVVKEAAACSCPALLIRDSCAAEGVQHRFTGFLAMETADSCSRVLLDACQSRESLATVGDNAGQHLYLSWEDAVAKAYARYKEVLRLWPGPLPYNAKTRWF